MVKTVILIVLALFLYTFEVTAQECVSDWNCTEWSVCSEMGFNTRTCNDEYYCPVPTDKPKEIKRCYDDNDYLPGEPEVVAAVNIHDDSMVHANNTAIETDTSEAHSDKPNIYVGLGIIAVFIIIGLLIGFTFKNQ